MKGIHAKASIRITTEAKMKKAGWPLLLACLAQVASAQVYKCEAEGRKAQYQSTPCTTGASVAVKVQGSARPQPARHTESPPTAQSVQDSQRALERARQFPLDNHLSMDLPNTSVRMALQIAADFVGYRLAIDPAINDTGNFNYKGLPAHAVLDDVARRFNLAVRTDNHTITVTRK